MAFEYLYPGLKAGASFHRAGLTVRLFPYPGLKAGASVFYAGLAAGALVPYRGLKAEASFFCAGLEGGLSAALSSREQGGAC